MTELFLPGLPLASRRNEFFSRASPEECFPTSMPLLGCPCAPSRHLLMLTLSGFPCSGGRDLASVAWRPEWETCFADRFLSTPLDSSPSSKLPKLDIFQKPVPLLRISGSRASISSSGFREVRSGGCPLLRRRCHAIDKPRTSGQSGGFCESAGGRSCKRANGQVVSRAATKGFPSRFRPRSAVSVGPQPSRDTRLVSRLWVKGPPLRARGLIPCLE